MKRIVFCLSLLMSFSSFAGDAGGGGHWPPTGVSVEQLSRRATIATYTLSIAGPKSMTGENIDKLQAECNRLHQSKVDYVKPIDLVRVYEGEIEAICVVKD